MKLSKVLVSDETPVWPAFIWWTRLCVVRFPPDLGVCVVLLRPLLNDLQELSRKNSRHTFWIAWWTTCLQLMCYWVILCLFLFFKSACITAFLSLIFLLSFLSDLFVWDAIFTFLHAAVCCHHYIVLCHMYASYLILLLIDRYIEGSC